MFSKARNRSDRPAASAAPSILSGDLTVTGDIVSEGEVQIDGNVEGDVRCTTLTVGITGFLTGQVFADHALVRGKVEGQIRANNVTLTRTARVVGDIVHESLMIEPGAHIEGHCQRLDAVTPPVAEKRVEAVTPPPPADKRLNLVVSESPSRGG